MIKSMTGFGRAGMEDDSRTIQAEVKTLNSKFLDLSLKLPRQFSEKEHEVRNLVQGILERGKVNLALDFIPKKSNQIPVTINEELFQAYFEKYQNLANSVVAEKSELFKLALQSPSVIVNMAPDEATEAEEEWELIQKVIIEALQKCDQFRKDEGESLFEKLKENIQVIESALQQVKAIEGQRKDRIKNRIRSNFQDWIEENDFDQNRFEQELIYYFEKLDITEELVRLETHLNYFIKVLNEETQQGKKLGFISQEIGREINTIGSKANDAGMQKWVILMKDELEKIKEQTLNVL
ncbi:YicC/YloC family endoribonuclease [Algoriphagus formosus]|uniref:YicC family protein n=1 Tax=Algoriphagus formosus TaxID=2007308 RepID=A0A4R5V0K1_9BACT|nr:YicC/YloC family endoribonuclease [Algoriphagus aquimaris]TDK44916.1 YicC family protein [Algoriphagus aquimaris]